MRSLAALDSAPAPATHRTLSHAEFLEKLDRIRAMAKPRGKDLLHSRAAYYLDDEQLAAYLAGEEFWPMRILVDTNVLLRLTHTGDPQYAAADGAAAALHAAGTSNGSGMPLSEAEAHVREFCDALPLVEDERGVFENWLAFVVANGVKGLKAFDVRPAASRERHGPSHVLTFNERDFRGFEGVAVLDPAAVAP